MIGQVIDTNSAWMGSQLNDVGVEIVEKISISDSHDTIVDALKNTVGRADVVLITGGLGPTKDDITKKAIADYLGVAMEFHEPTWERISRLFERWGRSTTEEHRQQCYMPQGTVFLPNKMGTAPGMQFEKGGTTLISMPGVPYEMKYIMEGSVLPSLKSRNKLNTIYHRTIRTIGEGESRIASRIGDITDSFPAYIKMAFLPSLGQVRLRISGRDNSGVDIKKEVDSWVETIQERLVDLVFGYDLETIEEVIGHLFRNKGLTLGLAESCTGGSISHRIVSVSGASDYYEGCVVSYSNAIKNKVLGVKTSTLDNYGAVSEQTVIEMAEGVRKVLGTDIGFSVSGIAGPGGGSEEKPVGTVWMAVTNGKDTVTQLIKAGKDREKNIIYSGTYGLNLIRKFIMAQ